MKDAVIESLKEGIEFEKIKWDSRDDVFTTNFRFIVEPTRLSSIVRDNKYGELLIDWLITQV